MSGVDRPRRRVIVLGAAVVFSGCFGIDTHFSGSDTDQTTTQKPSSTLDERTKTSSQVKTEPQNSSTEACEEPTPEPVPDVMIRNELEKTASIEITIQTLSDRTETLVHESNQTIDPGATIDLYDVLSDRATYRFTVELDDGTSATTDIETEQSRSSAVTIQIEDEESIEISQFNIVPSPTPTICP